MVQMYYVKASRNPPNTWVFEDEQTDWDNFPLNKTQEFATHTRKQIYWKTIRKGDWVVCHSSHAPPRRVKGKRAEYYAPLPRISAIAEVEASEHKSKKLKYAVTLKKVVEFYPIQVTQDWIKENRLKKAEPFKPGSNRCTITKLAAEEFRTIINAIKNEHKDKTEELAKYLNF